MKKEILGRLALASLMLAGAALGAAGSAGAADLMKAPVAAPYNWTGCYVGGFAGWGIANTWTSNDLGGFSAGANPWSYSENSSFVGGGTAGCNWQPWAGGGFVLGIEGEGGYLNLSAPTAQPLTTDVIGSSKIGSGYGMIAGRLGWAFFERVLWYGKAGVAFYDTSAAVTNLVPSPSLPDTITATGSKSMANFTVGTGVEYGWTEHWTGKAEYMYVAGGSSYNACGVDSALGQTFCWQQSPSPIHLVKFGVNYKF
jgi:outer membrane immunogenic protein